MHACCVCACVCTRAWVCARACTAEALARAEGARGPARLVNAAAAPRSCTAPHTVRQALAHLVADVPLHKDLAWRQAQDLVGLGWGREGKSAAEGCTLLRACALDGAAAAGCLQRLPMRCQGRPFSTAANIPHPDGIGRPSPRRARARPPRRRARRRPERPARAAAAMHPPARGCLSTRSTGTLATAGGTAAQRTAGPPRASSWPTTYEVGRACRRG